MASTIQQLESMRELAMLDAFRQARMRLLDSEMITENYSPQSWLSKLSDIKFRHHPYVTWESTYDDNIDQKPSGEKKGSFNNQLILGVKSNTGGRNWTSVVDVNIDATYYQNRKRDNLLGGEVNLDNYFKLGRYTLSVSDSYNNSQFDINEFLDTNSFQKFWQNDFNISLSRAFNRVGFDLGYLRTDYETDTIANPILNTGVNPDNSGLDSHTVDQVSLNTYFKIGRKTRLLYQYTFNRTHFKNNDATNSSYTYDNFILGLAGVLSPKVSGLLKFGYRAEDLKTQPDYNEPSVTGELAYVINKYTDASLFYQYLVHDVNSARDYYRENTFKISGNRRLYFNPKWKVSLSATIDRLSYSKLGTSDNVSNTYTYGVGLSYAFRKWLDFQFNYDRKEFSSKVDTSYNDNLFTFKTQAKF